MSKNNATDVRRLYSPHVLQDMLYSNVGIYLHLFALKLVDRNKNMQIIKSF